MGAVRGEGSGACLTTTPGSKHGVVDDGEAWRHRSSCIYPLKPHPLTTFFFCKARRHYITFRTTTTMRPLRALPLLLLPTISAATPLTLNTFDGPGFPSGTLTPSPNNPPSTRTSANKPSSTSQTPRRPSPKTSHSPPPPVIPQTPPPPNTNPPPHSAQPTSPQSTPPPPSPPSPPSSAPPPPQDTASAPPAPGTRGMTRSARPPRPSRLSYSALMRLRLSRTSSSPGVG